MNLSVTVRGMDDPASLRSEAETRVWTVLNRFQRRVRNASVLLEDVTGAHKQSVDKRCRIYVQLKRGGELTIDEIGTNILASLAIALDRLKAAVSRKVGRLKWGVGEG